MEIDYQEFYAEAFAVTNNANKAHQQAIKKIKLKHKNEKVTVADEDGVQREVSPYEAEDLGEED